ncbi:MAG: MFS transporter [Halapricum sp.]
MEDPRTGTALADAVVGGRRALATVFVIVLIDLIGFGIVVPILPFYVRSFGANDVVYGLLAASYSLLQFAFAPLLGRWSDSYGRRPVLMLSTAGNVVAWITFGLGTEVGVVFGTTAAIGTLFGARMLAGAMGGNIATAQAYVADVTPIERRTAALGLIGAAFGLGFVVGPALGAVLASRPVVDGARAVLPSVIPTTRFTLPSFGAAAASSIAFLATWRFLPEPRSPAQREVARNRTRQSLFTQFRGALASERLRPLVLAFFVASLAFSGVQIAFVPYLADVYGYDAAGAGLFLTYIGALSVLNQGVLVGRLSRRFETTRLAVGGAALLTAALAALPFSPTIGAALALPRVAGLDASVLVLLVVLAVLSVGNALLNVALAALVSTAASEAEQGSAFGVTQGAGSLGRTVGPPAMTTLYVLLARWSPFVAGAALTVGVVGLLVGVARRRVVS